MLVRSINQIRKQSNILDDLKKEGKIIIVGGLYDIETGEVTFFE
jgi:carbonic anhydrase